MGLRENSEGQRNFVLCNGHNIKAQNSVKYLGLNLDDQLSGEAIVNNIVQKVNTRLKDLERQFSFLEEKSVCTALIQCHLDHACFHLDHACLSWYSGLNKNLKKILHICQNKTVRFIKNLGPQSHIGFSDLIDFGMLNGLNNYVLVMHIRFSMIDPAYLSENFIKTSDIHLHNTRGSSENFIVHSVSGVALSEIGILYLQRSK